METREPYVKTWTYRITIMLVPVACNIMYRFSNCQRPPINCEPR